LRAPNPTVTASKLPSGWVSASASPSSNEIDGAFRRASSSIAGAKSIPVTSAPRRASSMARSPVPVATSSAVEPGPTPARSAARSRQRWCMPAVITEFIRS
jgi:hypothetical protein